MARSLAQASLHRYLPLGLLLAVASIGPVYAQASSGAYPSRPIRFIVPYAPGGASDTSSRAIAAKLADVFGQRVVVDNRPGGTGVIGMELAMRAAPDGYTIVLATTAITINKALARKDPYDIQRDFEPVTQLTSQQYCLSLHPSVPATSVKELIAVVRAKPDGYSFATPGTYSLIHLGGTLFNTMTDTKWVHVPYKGGGPALIDLMAGQTQIMFVTFLSGKPLFRSGKLRCLAVSSLKRSESDPSVPTISEAGVPGFDIAGWYGIQVPARTPRAIIEALHSGLLKAVRSEEVSSRLLADGSEVSPSDPASFRRHIEAEIEKFSRLIKTAGLLTQ